MQKYATTEKKIGETPLQALERFRKIDTAFESIPITYAGRLDPMATGKLILLLGDECKRREIYTSYDKEYEFEILLDIKTDTGDVLGLVSQTQTTSAPYDERIKNLLETYVGVHTFPYPSFSSKTVEGKQLFEHALEGTLDTIDIPKIETEILSISYLGQQRVSAEELLRVILEKVDTVTGTVESEKKGADFRKSEIQKKWKETLRDSERGYTILRMRAIVTSGSYIRTLAEDIAEKLGTIGLAYSIHRTKIGTYIPLTKRRGIWLKKF